MQDAEIFIMPNIKVDNDMEGFGLVALEACMNNCIVLASNIDGITDAIIDNSNGFLVKSQDVMEWVNKINEVLNIKDKSTLIKHFKEFTMTNYSWTKMCNEYEREFLS
jgi:phosphatidylinositol alpha-1,6-mannosyltransferase